MATLNEDDNMKSVSSIGDISDIESLDSSVDKSFDEYGVWVKSGPEDIGESSPDEEFEISDLTGNSDDDLLTEEEEELLADFEEQIESPSDDVELPDMTLDPDEEISSLPDFSSEISGTDSISDIGSFEIDIPEEENVVMSNDDTASDTFEIEKSDTDFEAGILKNLPEVDLSDDLPSMDDISTDIQTEEVSFETTESSREDFTEISLDSFSIADDQTDEVSDAVSGDPVEDDFLDLDLDEDEGSGHDVDDSIFTAEELDDFFGVPIEDVTPGSENKSEIHETEVRESSYFDDVPKSDDDLPLETMEDFDLETDSSVSVEISDEDLLSDISEPIQGGEEESSEELTAESLDFVSEGEPDDMSLEFADDTVDETVVETEKESVPEIVVNTESDPLTAGIENIESRVGAVRNSGNTETSILLQIERELASIKEELSGLKKELSSIREGSNKTDTESLHEDLLEKSSGFFDEDEDETIALTGDELDNILNTANITEEAGAVESPSESESLFESGNLDSEQEYVSQDEEIIPLEDSTIKNESALLPPEAEDEQPISDENEEFPESGIKLVEVSESDSEIDALFDEQPESITLTGEDSFQSSGDALPVFEEIQEDSHDEENSLEIESFSDKGEEPDEDSVEEVFIPLSDESENESVLESVADDAFENIETVTDETDNSLSLQQSDKDADDIALSGSLRDEIRSVLSYMDSLLEALPESKIEEFARSEHFDVYRKLFEELGLGK